jgi:SGNH domain (fused to AT3 domains)
VSGPLDPSSSAVPGASGVSAAPPVSSQVVLGAVANATSIVALPSDLTPTLANAGKDTGFTLVGSRGCEPGFAATTVELSHCVFGDKTATKTLIVVGDSHSAMWLPAFDLVGVRTGWKIIDFNKVNCGAAAIEPWLTQESRPYAECVAWHQWVEAEINSIAPDLVVFTSEIGSGKIGDGSTLTPSGWETGMEKTLRGITAVKTKKAILGDMPYIWSGSYDAGPNCLSTHSSRLAECSATAAKAVRLSFQTAEEDAAAASGASYLNPTPWFCSATCWPVINDIQVYSDWQHITASYAKYLSGALQASLGPAMAS